jgi:putative ABC transport system permease protein
MNLLENIAVAINGIKSNKMRSFLTMLGIIIGISAVILITTLGTMITNAVTGTLDDLGFSNLVQVSLQFKRGSTRGSQFLTSNDMISDEMLAKMKERFGERITGVAVSTSGGSGSVRYDSNENPLNVSLTGASEEALRTNSTKIIAGRYTSEEDAAKTNYVINIPSDMAETMFGDARSALGQTITINERSNSWAESSDILDFTVVGVYDYDPDPLTGMVMALMPRTYDCYIPITTARRMTGQSAFEG